MSLGAGQAPARAGAGIVAGAQAGLGHARRRPRGPAVCGQDGREARRDSTWRMSARASAGGRISRRR